MATSSKCPLIVNAARTRGTQLQKGQGRGPGSGLHKWQQARITDNRSKCVVNVLIAGKAGTGESHVLARTFVEGDSDQAFYKFLSVPHHGSARTANATLEPPHVAEFLMLLLPLKYRENLIGDAEEEYWTRSLPRFGVRKARLIFWIQAIHASLIFLARPLGRL